MTASNYWQLFLETGAPELYLMYQQALKMEETNVSDRSGRSPSGYGLQ